MAGAPKEIKTALQPFGYYAPEISQELTQTSPDVWNAVYTIRPGAPVRVGRVDVRIIGEAQSDPDFQAFLKNLPISAGMQLSHPDYEKTKNDLLKLAIEKGYFEAGFLESVIRIDLDQNRAEIILHLQSGSRYRFGTVILQQDILKPEFIRRFIPFEEGDHYSTEKLLQLQQALNDSNYFQEVEVLAQQENRDTLTMPVTVRLVPRKRHRYVVGAGYGTDTGVRGKIGWEMPRINRRGHRFDTTIRASEVADNVVLNYRVPVYDPRTDQVIYSAGINREHREDVQSTMRTLSVSLAHARGLWREAVSLSYQDEAYEIGDESGSSILLMPGIAWNRVFWTDDRIYPTRGLRFNLGFRGATSRVISDTDFAQVQSGFKFVQEFLFGRFLTRANIGSTATAAFEEIPASVRFFTGGSDSVRGYAYQSLGPQDAQGNVVGGNHFFAGSVEYEIPIKGNWSSAVFYDAGNAMDNFTTPLKHGAGAGIRWRSPVGPVRVDIATPVGQASTSWRLHLNIGPDL